RPRARARLGRPALEQRRVELAVRVDGVRDVARVDVPTCTNELRDPACLGELPHRLRLRLGLPRALTERDAACFEHARNQVVELEERVPGVVAETLLEVAPLALPFVPVEAGVLHETGRARTRRNAKPDSRLAACGCSSSARARASTPLPGGSPRARP